LLLDVSNQNPGKGVGEKTKDKLIKQLANLSVETTVQERGLIYRFAIGGAGAIFSLVTGTMEPIQIC